MTAVSIIITAVLIILWALLIARLIYILGLIWYKYPFKAMTWFYHGIIGWHKPTIDFHFDGKDFTSKCRFCGKDIMLSNKGIWILK